MMVCKCLSFPRLQLCNHVKVMFRVFAHIGKQRRQVCPDVKYKTVFFKRRLTAKGSSRCVIEHDNRDQKMNELELLSYNCTPHPATPASQNATRTCSSTLYSTICMTLCEHVHIRFNNVVRTSYGKRMVWKTIIP